MASENRKLVHQTSRFAKRTFLYCNIKGYPLILLTLHTLRGPNPSKLHPKLGLRPRRPPSVIIIAYHPTLTPALLFLRIIIES